MVVNFYKKAVISTFNKIIGINIYSDALPFG